MPAPAFQPCPKPRPSPPPAPQVPPASPTTDDILIALRDAHFNHFAAARTLSIPLTTLLQLLKVSETSQAIKDLRTSSEEFLALRAAQARTTALEVLEKAALAARAHAEQRRCAKALLSAATFRKLPRLSTRCQRSAPRSKRRCALRSTPFLPPCSKFPSSRISSPVFQRAPVHSGHAPHDPGRTPPAPSAALRPLPTLVSGPAEPQKSPCAESDPRENPRAPRVSTLAALPSSEKSLPPAATHCGSSERCSSPSRRFSSSSRPSGSQHRRRLWNPPRGRSSSSQSSNWKSSPRSPPVTHPRTPWIETPWQVFTNRPESALGCSRMPFCSAVPSSPGNQQETRTRVVPPNDSGNPVAPGFQGSNLARPG